MTTLLLVVAGLVFAWWAMQFILVLGYCRAMLRPRARPVVTAWPRFAVFVPVRGFDATLLAAIRSVLAVDYPDFCVRILFDSRDDAAWEPVCAELARLDDPRVRVQVIEQRRETCGLLCNNLVAGIESLDVPCDLVAICAADMIVPTHWLRVMAEAMVDPTAGTTLGNRWYLPPVPTAGGLTRWIWNAGAVVMMHWFRIPWSGGMALRTTDLQERGFLAQWTTAMVEDVSLEPQFASDREQLRFIPELIVIDRADIALPACYRFIRRQLLWTRLYSPNWPIVMTNAAFGTLVTFAPVLLAFVSLGVGDFLNAAFAVLIFGCYLLGTAPLIPLVEFVISQVLKEKIPPFAGLPWVATCFAIPLAQCVYFAAMCSAVVARSAEWRGLHYEIRGPWKVRRLNYEPYTAEQERP